MSEKVKAVIYARYSSSGQREESIEGQLRDCKAYAKRMGMVVVGEYIDRALTGTTDQRPDFQRMIRDAERGTFDIVLCWKSDRFSRDRFDAITYKARLKKSGVRVLYAMETVPEGPEGVIVESLLEGFAEYYSKNLSENVKRGNHDSALKFQTLGVTLFGYRKAADKTFEVDPVTGPVAKKIFEDYVAGKPALEIVKELNDAGYRTVRGQLFNKNSVRHIINNEKYYGLYKHGQVRVDGAIPAIVSKETWDAAQRMCKRRRRAPAAKKAEGGFLLTSKLFCGHCSEPMTGDSGTGKLGTIYQYYICNNRRKKKCKKERAPKEWIENLVVNELIKIVHDDSLIELIADKYMEWQEKQSIADPVQGLRQTLKTVEAAIRNNIVAIDAGLVSETLVEHMQDLERQKSDLLDGIAKAEAGTPTIDRDTIVWFLKSFREGNTDDVSWRILLVETFLNAAYLYDDGRLLLVLNFSGEQNTVELQTAEDVAEHGEPLSGFELCANSTASINKTAHGAVLLILIRTKRDSNPHYLPMPSAR